MDMGSLDIASVYLAFHPNQDGLQQAVVLYQRAVHAPRFQRSPVLTEN